MSACNFRLPMCLFLLFVYLCVCLYCSSTCVSGCTACLPVCLVALFVYLCVWLHCLSTCVSGCTVVCLPVCLAALFVYLCVWLHCLSTLSMPPHSFLRCFLLSVPPSFSQCLLALCVRSSCAFVCQMSCFFRLADPPRALAAVSYTHLTLPTRR